MMIPIRRRANLPAGHAWAIREVDGQLTVYLAQQVPPDSALEHVLAKEATKAWRDQHRHHTLTPGLIAAPSSWPWRGVRHHTRLISSAGASVAAGGLALTAALMLTPHAPPPPPDDAASAPHPTVKTPRHARPHQPGPPSPRRSPAKPGRTSSKPPTAGRLVRVDVDGLPVKVPPIEVTPPVVDSPLPVLRCRLVKVQVGKLVRACL